MQKCQHNKTHGSKIILNIVLYLKNGNEPIGVLSKLRQIKSKE